MSQFENLLKKSMILLLCVFTLQAAGKTNVVVMLGDSTTLCTRNKSGAKLTDYVQSYLRLRNRKAVIVNSGAGGDTAKGGFERLQESVLRHDPVVVTISFGLNDTGKLTTDEFRDWMEKIVQSVQTNTHAKILLVTSTPFNNARHAWKDKFLDQGGLDEFMDANICAAVRALAKKHSLPLCDLHGHFAEKIQRNPKFIDMLLFPDGVHLTDQGNKLAADFLAPAIAELLPKP